MELEISMRLRWMRMYHETGNAGLVCTRCGISRPTLRKWLRRYQEAGEEGLRAQSRRPLTSPNRKVSDADRATILRPRAERKGARRIQNELRLYEQRELSLATIHKVLCEASVKPLVSPGSLAQLRRYSRPVPGDRVQMDTMKIARGVYQYTAIDDCSRFRVLAFYPRRNARNLMMAFLNTASPVVGLALAFSVVFLSASAAAVVALPLLLIAALIGILINCFKGKEVDEWLERCFFGLKEAKDRFPTLAEDQKAFAAMLS